MASLTSSVSLTTRVVSGAKQQKQTRRGSSAIVKCAAAPERGSVSLGQKAVATAAALTMFLAPGAAFAADKAALQAKGRTFAEATADVSNITFCIV
jgi:outer membrane translocation and assembly module TamA